MQLRLGTGRVLAQVCPASRGSRSRQRPSREAGRPVPTRNAPKHTPSADTEMCSLPKPQRHTPTGAETASGPVSVGDREGPWLEAVAGARRGASHHSAAAEPRPHVGPSDRAMSPSPAVTHAAGAPTQSERRQEEGYRPPPFMAPRGGANLRGGRQAARLPSAAAGKAVRTPCSSLHRSENRGEGCHPLRLFVPICPHWGKAVCDVVRKDLEVGPAAPRVGLSPVAVLTSETVTGRERRGEQPRAQEPAPGPQKPGRAGPVLPTP